MWACSPTRSTAPERRSRSTASAGGARCGGRSRTWSRPGRSARTRGCGPRRPGVTRTRTCGGGRPVGDQRARGGRSRRRSRRRCGRRRPRGPGRSSAVGLVVAVEHQPVGGHAGGEGDVELAAGGHVEVHAPPRGPARPWPCTGTPWWRRPRRRRRPRPPPGSGPAGGPRRRRRAACRTRAARSSRSQPPIDRRPSSPTVGGVGQQLPREGSRRGHIDSGARRPRAGRGRWPGPIRTASTSHSRAWVRPGSTLSAIT